MKRSLTKIAVLGLLATPMAAFAADYNAADTNGDGMLSLEELQAVLPELTTDNFITIDADGDGLVNPDELAAAQTEGLLPASDG